MEHAAASGADFAYLLGLYLGDGCLSSNGDNVSLRLMLDTGYPGIIAEAREAIGAVISGQHTSLYQRPNENCLTITAYNRHWSCLFPQHGPGRKHERPIALVEWQQDIVEEHTGASSVV